MIAAGIDEAGYGPLLGPLVTALAAFRTPAAEVPDLWRELGAAVHGEPDRRDPEGLDRLAIIDSKLLHRAGKGLKDLETAALACSALLDPAGAWPTSAVAFLDRHLIGAPLPIERYPWYRGEIAALALPLAADGERVHVHARRLRAAAAERRIAPLLLGVRPILEAEFSAAAERHGSKARLLFDLNSDLLHALAARSAEPAHVRCDQHGGRRDYSALLAGAFPLRPVAARPGPPGRASYAIGPERPGGPTLTVEYEARGERLGLEVALASIFAKYTRELFVELLNRHFARRVRGLCRTAGYVTDGRRFVADLERREALAVEERALLLRRR